MNHLVQSFERESMNKNILLTGATAGIGLDTAKLLAEKTKNQDVELILANRNSDKAEAVKQTLSKITNNKISLVTVDFNDLTSVKKCSETLASRYEKIDILINNAGIFTPQAQTTQNGYEKHIGVNFLAPVLFTERLLPTILKSENPRIIHVASIAHLAARNGIEFDSFNGFSQYNATKAYGHSKLANLLYSSALAHKLASSSATQHATSNAMHPGGAASSIYRDMPAPIRKFMAVISISTKKSAKRIVKMALDDAWATKNGAYTSVQTPAWKSKFAKDDELAEKLYQHALELLSDYL